MKILSDDVLNQIVQLQKLYGLQHFGSKLSDYEVLGQLGRGATAYVYRVRARKVDGSVDEYQNQDTEK